MLFSSVRRLVMLVVKQTKFAGIGGSVGQQTVGVSIAHAEKKVSGTCRLLAVRGRLGVLADFVDERGRGCLR